jgi:hypothetical protein
LSNGGRAARTPTLPSSAGIARITPKELTAGENISIVDLGQPMDIEAFPQIR